MTKLNNDNAIIEVHPSAALFPMLAEDELLQLADDIKANGLIHPIILDAKGVLIDGRNRLRACEIASVEPTFETFTGDPLTYIVSANSKRRNMTKGALAMTLTELFLKNNPDATQAEIAKAAGISQGQIAYAAMVIAYAPALVPSVINGATPLNDAYAEAQAAKKRGDVDQNELTALRRRSPELAAKVVDGELTLAGARAELNERERQRKQAQDDLIDTVRTVFATTGAFSARTLREQADELGLNVEALLGPYASNLEATKRGLMNLLDSIEGAANGK